jgi:ribosomal protein S18 acetylase RimI-like enzyme
MTQRTLVRHLRRSISTMPPSGWVEEPPPVKTRGIKRNTALFCGWGRLIFGQTFSDHNRIIDIFSSEPAGKRDLAIYVKNHHVLLAKAPNLLFVDPSHTYRLWLHHYRMPRKRPSSFRIRLLRGKEDAEQVNTIYRKCGLIESPVSTIVENQKTHTFSYFVAEDSTDGRIIGTITGIDHKEAFNDPENGASFWCLAVDPDRRARGVGRALVRCVAEHYLAKGREYLDLSVLHDNHRAIRLYRSLGFRRVPVFVVKRKNEINRIYYTGGPKP